MDIDPIYKAKERRGLGKVVVVTRREDRLARAFAYGDSEVSPYHGIKGEANHFYTDRSTPLDGKIDDVVVVTLDEGEKLSDINDTDLEGTYVTAVTTLPKPAWKSNTKPGHKMLKAQDMRELNGQLGWVDKPVDGVLGFNEHPGSINKNVLFGTVLTEARRKQVDAFPVSWFRNRKVNTRPRVVDGQTITSLDFFIEPDATELKRLNDLMKRCQGTGERPTLFIPTCPPDKYSLKYEIDQHGKKVYKNTIGYSSSNPLTTGISWAAQNCLDLLDELIPQMDSKGVTPHVVFGFGDYEYHGGARRGMTQEGFMGKTNESAGLISERMKDMYAKAGKDVHITTLENPDGVHTVHIRHNGLILVTISGIVELAGGLPAWNKRLEQAKQLVDAAAESTEHRNLFGRVEESRAPMTEFWIKQKRKAPTPENRREEFRIDTSSYVGFHSMVNDLWGENAVVVAGDARGPELLVSRIAGTLLISGSGMYDGASFDK